MEPLDGVFGVITDVHANREALDAVLDSLSGENVRTVVCLGDVVGYNSDSNYCVSRIRECHAMTIAGNHERILCGTISIRRSAFEVGYSLRRTRKVLREDNRMYLSALPAHLLLKGNYLFLHGGIRDVGEYMHDERIVETNDRYRQEDYPGIRVCFFGHTHDRKVYRVRGGEAQALTISREMKLPGDGVYYVNPGPVDGSRGVLKGRAEYMIFDSDTDTVRFREVPYDHEKTERKSSSSGYRPTRLSWWIHKVRRKVFGRMTN